MSILGLSFRVQHKTNGLLVIKNIFNAFFISDQADPHGLGFSQRLCEILTQLIHTNVEKQRPLASSIHHTVIHQQWKLSKNRLKCVFLF